MLEVQSQELTLRSKEMDLRFRELDNNSAHAEKILGAQVQDRTAQRNHDRGVQRDKLAFALLFVVSLLVFAVVGMLYGSAELVKEILQIVVGTTAGAFGGYGLGRRKTKKEDEEG